MIRDHGQAKKYYHDVEGYNGRMDAIQAGLLRIKLNHLPEWNAQRQAHSKEYNRQFAAVGNPVLPPHEPTSCRAVYHLYVVRSDDRENLMAFLNQQGVGSGIHYPIPLHLQEAYRHLEYRQGDFPVSERVAREIVSLPMFPQLRAEQQKRVVDAVAQFVESKMLTPAR